MDYKNINDYELIYMVKENDDDSLECLFNKYTPIIKSISNEYYQKYNSYGYDYDDFLQEANIAFYNAYLAFRESMDVLFYTFVTVCIRRRLLTFCRNITNNSKNISFNQTVDVERYDIVDDKADMDLFMRETEIEQLLHDYILNLPLNYSSVFELRLNGFGYKEISCLLDIPSSTVEYRFRHIKNNLSVKLKTFF